MKKRDISSFLGRWQDSSGHVILITERSDFKIMVMDSSRQQIGIGSFNDGTISVNFQDVGYDIKMAADGKHLHVYDEDFFKK
jgi:hypothetical protein